MYPKTIKIKGAKEHNLKNIDVEIPCFKFVVITGVSGSGKSSLAFDTLYAEGQRRYVESLSSYARQFINQMEKPKVDYITGLSPSIAIEQKIVGRNPRSTVGTVTEIYDYLRVLFARIGIQYCTKCGKKVCPQTINQIIQNIDTFPNNKRIKIIAPIVQNRKGTFKDFFESMKARGFIRVRVNGEEKLLDEEIKLSKTKKHTIEVIIDRLKVIHRNSVKYQDYYSRLVDSLETSVNLGSGTVLIETEDQKQQLYSVEMCCPDCGISFPKLMPAMFSFNSPSGMCHTCNGLGKVRDFDVDLLVDNEKSLHKGGLLFWGELENKKKRGSYREAKHIVESYGCTMDTPWKNLPEKCRHVILYGDQKIKGTWEHKHSRGEYEYIFEGIMPRIRRRYQKTKSDMMTQYYYGRFLSEKTCPDCHGEKLRTESLSVLLGGKNINQVTSLTIKEALIWVKSLWNQIDDERKTIAEELIAEIRGRLQFMMNVGLHYLTLDRPAPTLSGGEGQRIRLARQIGCGLVGVLYVLDEPTTGLHFADIQKLLDVLHKLTDAGNTVIIIEHNLDVIKTADWIIDLGPEGGEEGGTIVAQGYPEEIVNCKNSYTGQFLKRIGTDNIHLIIGQEILEHIQK